MCPDCFILDFKPDFRKLSLCDIVFVLKDVPNIPQTVSLNTVAII